jgi:hypothetical protein
LVLGKVRFKKVIWKIRIIPFIENIIDALTQCPVCRGEGGEKEIITDEGLGPWYPCEFCNGKGYMNVFKKVYYLILLAHYKRLENGLHKW